VITPQPLRYAIRAVAPPPIHGDVPTARGIAEHALEGVDVGPRPGSQLHDRRGPIKGLRDPELHEEPDDAVVEESEQGLQHLNRRRRSRTMHAQQHRAPSHHRARDEGGRHDGKTEQVAIRRDGHGRK
jgi:hypothetical protein